MTTHDNIALQDQYSNDLERAELKVTHMISSISLWGLIILPLIPASLVTVSIGMNFGAKLHIADWIAWTIGVLTGAGVELLGPVSIRLALKMRKFNHRADGHTIEKAPIQQGYLAAIAYVVIVLSLTVLLKIWPEFAIWALIPMSLLGALGDWLFMLSGDHNERENVLRKLISADETSADSQSIIEQLTNELDQLRKQLADTINQATELIKANTLIGELRQQLSDAQVDREELIKANTLIGELRRNFDQMRNEQIDLITELNEIKTERDQALIRVEELIEELDDTRHAQPVIKPTPQTRSKPAPKPIKNGDNKAIIFDILRQHEGKPASEIKEADLVRLSGVSRGSVINSMKFFKENGYVTINGTVKINKEY